jgi:glycosyltransferase involved in cell wall biosynthesis
MSQPLVSVIMPVYNTASYLKEAIESILDQTFGDFEYIIINDGSSDHSDDVVRSFNDTRIKYVSNQGNKGLVYTLNRGLDLATGQYIARMDGDDISLPDRFQLQLSYLQQHPLVDVLATRVKLINENGAALADWADESKMISAADIFSFLPVNNCLAHPSIMAKSSVMKSFRYREDQKESEDYDLWLRLAAAGKQIHKLEQSLVKHRIRPSSFTRNRQQNVFRKLSDTKSRFAIAEIRRGNINPFVIKTLGYAGVDRVKAFFKSMKPQS